LGACVLVRDSDNQIIAIFENEDLLIDSCKNILDIDGDSILYSGKYSYTERKLLCNHHLIDMNKIIENS